MPLRVLECIRILVVYSEFQTYTAKALREVWEDVIES